MKVNGLNKIQFANNNILNILGRLNVGDIVRAQILEIASNELLLKLFDGTEFKAFSTSKIEAKPGETLDFLVNEKNESQIVLETLKKEEAKPKSSQRQTKQELIQVNIKPSKRNIQIAEELKLNNIPLTKELFSDIDKLLSKFKSANIEKAVFMIANKLELNDMNIRLLDELIYGRYKIGFKLEELMESLSKINDKEFVKSVVKDLMNLKFINHSFKYNVSDSLNELLDKESTLIKSDTVKEMIGRPVFKRELLNFIKENVDAENDIKVETDNFIDLKTKDFKIISVSERRVLTDLISRIFEKLKIHSQDLDIHQNGISYNKDFGLKAEDVFDELLKDFYIKIHSEKSKPDIDVKSLYKDIYIKLEVIKENLNTLTGGEKNEIHNSIDYIQNSIKFLNDINNYSTYVQIPFNFLESNYTGELYVLKRGHRKRKINPEDVTMLLSLNTKNLGRIDTLVGIKKRNISLNLRVEKQYIADFIKSNYRRLYESLAKRGFNLFDIKYRVADESLNILNIEKRMEKELKLAKSSVDFRV